MIPNRALVTDWASGTCTSRVPGTAGVKFFLIDGSVVVRVNLGKVHAKWRAFAFGKVVSPFGTALLQTSLHFLPFKTLLMADRRTSVFAA